VIDTVIMGNRRLYEIGKQKDAIYAKEDFSDEDGILVSELESEFAEMGGWEADSDASKLLQGLGIKEEKFYLPMSALAENEKVKVLLAQALFGNPDIVLLDEPTNGLDIASVSWLEDFLLDFNGTLIVVSHDRHFLNTICTHIVDIDYNKIKLYVGNYEFWYESSQMIQRMIRNQNKKNEEKAKELQNFIARFSANKSKSKQATSRKKLLEKLTIEELPASSRKYSYVGFDMDREAGKEILSVEGLTKTVNGVKVLNNVSFRVNKGTRLRLSANTKLRIPLSLKS
jgi:ATPase subunit of ABC transporter with duplicated ATPase domains